MNQVTLILASRFENVAIACACAKAFAGVYFTAEALAELDNALAEAINNCIEHAYDGAEDQFITLHFTLSDDCLAVEIIDDGDVILDAALVENISSDFDYDPLDISQLPEGGFGLKIIKSCVDEFSYRRQNNQNHWFLKKRRL